MPKPDPAQADARDNAYVFERRVVFKHGDGSSSNGFIDCYRRAAFILEAKQTKLAQGHHHAAADAHPDQSVAGVRVFDPACGTTNFLYATLEHLKRLEGEVLDLLDQLGDTQGRLDTEGLTVDSHQFLGLELSPRAAAIAELVLWIGYLQWHYRTRGNVSPNRCCATSKTSNAVMRCWRMTAARR